MFAITIVAPPKYREYEVNVVEFDARWVFAEIPIPRKFFNALRGQYRADELAEYLSRKYTVEGRKVFVVDADGYVEGLNFVFGVALPAHRTAVVFTNRLKGVRFEERLAKEITHEAGHLYGLGHCPDPSCVMSFSNSVLDVDRKSTTFCPSCKLKLRRASGY